MEEETPRWQDGEAPSEGAGERIGRDNKKYDKTERIPVTKSESEIDKLAPNIIGFQSIPLPATELCNFARGPIIEFRFARTLSENRFHTHDR